MKQMYVISDCLLKLGYRNLALAAQSHAHKDFLGDFISLIEREAKHCKDYVMLSKLYTAHLG